MKHIRDWLTTEVRLTKGMFVAFLLWYMGTLMPTPGLAGVFFILAMIIFVVS